MTSLGKIFQGTANDTAWKSFLKGRKIATGNDRFLLLWKFGNDGIEGSNNYYIVMLLSLGPKVLTFVISQCVHLDLRCISCSGSIFNHLRMLKKSYIY